MAKNIYIDVEGKTFAAELNDSSAAKGLVSQLPLRTTLSRWGDEYYGSCGFSVKEDSSARENMEIGEIALWPPGNAICLFFGPTPASTDGKPRAASPVIPIGRIIKDVTDLEDFGSSVDVTIHL